MAQLDTYGLHEIFLSGTMIGLCLTYGSEGLESNASESAKVAIYSSVLF